MKEYLIVSGSNAYAGEPSFLTKINLRAETGWAVHTIDFKYKEALMVRDVTSVS